MQELRWCRSDAGCGRPAPSLLRVGCHSSRTGREGALAVRNHAMSCEWCLCHARKMGGVCYYVRPVIPVLGPWGHEISVDATTRMGLHVLYLNTRRRPVKPEGSRAGRRLRFTHLFYGVPR